MPTNAKAIFDLNIKRSGWFLEIHQAVQGGAGAPLMPVRELPRAAVVFAIGALDAYLSEVSAEVMVRQLESASLPPEARDILRRIQSELPMLALELALLPSHTDRA